MARSEARLYTDIWDDADFLAAPPSEQRLYMFLISQRDLTHSGVIPLRAQRWARKGASLTAGDIERDLEGLHARRFLVVDWDNGEVLVRSLIRRDKVYRQPNVMKAAIDYVPLIESPAILHALAAELARIRVEAADLSKPMLETLEAMENALAERVPTDPAPSPERASGNPTEKGSRNPSDIGSEKATAKSPRGTGVVTTVTTDSPLPDSPLIPPPAGVASRSPRDDALFDVSKDEAPPEPRSVNELMAYWLERCNARPPQRVVGHMSKEISSLIKEGISPEYITAGIDDFLTKDLSPGLLPNLVNSAMNRRPAAARASPSAGPEPGYFKPLPGGDS